MNAISSTASSVGIPLLLSTQSMTTSIHTPHSPSPVAHKRLSCDAFDTVQCGLAQNATAYEADNVAPARAAKSAAVALASSYACAIASPLRQFKSVHDPRDASQGCGFCLGLACATAGWGTVGLDDSVHLTVVCAHGREGHAWRIKYPPKILPAVFRSCGCISTLLCSSVEACGTVRTSVDADRVIMRCRMGTCIGEASPRHTPRKRLKI